MRLAALLGTVLPPALTALAFRPLADAPLLDLADRSVAASDRWRGLDGERIAWMTSALRDGVRQPLAWASLALDHALGGGDGPGLHRTQIALHVLTAVAIAVLVLTVLDASGAARLWRRAAPLAAGLAGAAWAAHPLRVEAVATVSARGEVLATLLGVAGSVLWVRALTPRRVSRGALAGAGVCLALATTASPSAAALLVGWWALARWLRRTAPASAPAASPATWPLAAVGVLPAVLLLATLSARPDDGPLPAAARVAAAGHSVLAPLWDTLAPVGLRPFHGSPPGFPDAVPAAWWVQTALAAALLAFAAVRARRGRGDGLAVLACFAAAAVATAFCRDAGGSDRVAYAATVPLYVALGVAIGEGAGCCLAFLGVPLAAVLLVAPAVAAHRLAAAWTDEDALVARVLDLDPQNDRVRGALGDAARGRGSPAEAQAHYERSASAGGVRPFAETGLGALALDRGDVAAASAHLERATAAAPWLADAHRELGVVRIAQGRADAAARALETAVRLDDGDAAAWFALGRARILAGERGAAAEAFRRALVLDPADGRVREELDRLR